MPSTTLPASTRRPTGRLSAAPAVSVNGLVNGLVTRLVIGLVIGLVSVLLGLGSATTSAQEDTPYPTLGFPPAGANDWACGRHPTGPIPR